jgi:ribosomal protein S7
MLINNNNNRKKKAVISLKLAYYNIFNLRYFKYLFGNKIKGRRYNKYLKKRYINIYANIKKFNNLYKHQKKRTIYSYHLKYMNKRGALSNALSLLVQLNLNLKRREKKNVDRIYAKAITRFQPFVGGKTRVKSGNTYDIPYTLSKKENETSVIKTLVKVSREFREQSRIITMENELSNGISNNVIASNIFQRRLLEAIILLKNSRGNIKYKSQ